MSSTGLLLTDSESNIEFYIPTRPAFDFNARARKPIDRGLDVNGLLLSFRSAFLARHTPMCWHPHGTLAALSNERRFAIAHVARDNETTCREVFRSMHRVEFIAETSLCSCLVKTSPPSYCDSGRRSALTALALTMAAGPPTTPPSNGRGLDEDS